jgi:hypothetical protein
MANRALIAALGLVLLAGSAFAAKNSMFVVVGDRCALLPHAWLHGSAWDAERRGGGGIRRS